MQTNSFDREQLGRWVEAESSLEVEHYRALIRELLLRTQTHNQFPMPELPNVEPKSGTGNAVTVRHVSDPATEKQWETSGRFVHAALKWARKIGKDDIEVAFDGGTDGVKSSRRGPCGLGSHRLEEGTPICKIEYFKSNGALRTVWGCKVCFDAIVEDLKLEVTG